MIGLCRSSLGQLVVLLASTVGWVERSPFAITIVKTAIVAAASFFLEGLAKVTFRFLQAIAEQDHHSHQHSHQMFLHHFIHFKHFKAVQ
jgi:hypothetical protein